MHLRVNGGSLDDPAQEEILPQMIGVLDQGTGLNYRVLTNYNNTAVPSWTYRAAMAYVTGSHAVKFGFNRTHGRLDENNYTLNPVSYRFSNNVPNQITQRALVRSITNLDNDLGLYVQDRWTVNRWTIQGALRFDYFATSFPEQTVGPATLAPNRNITFPAADNISWKDLTYRSGFAYDIFGTGKTALKVSFNKYLLGQTLNGLGRDPNPTLAMNTTANRPWTDANRDFIPQCDLTNLQPNGECGLIDNLAFGSTIPAATFDKDLISGFNNRQTNWEMSAGVQHELMPRVALDVGYFRRAWAHFRVTDNLATAPGDFTPFSIVVPSNPLLPNGGGNTLGGFYNVVPAKAGQVNNLNALSDKYGNMYENWNGVDVTVNMRLQNGLTFQGGLSSGKTMEDNCEIVAALPEMNNQAANGTLPASWRSAEYCHRESPFLTQFKMYGVYILPKVDVQISGTFRSTPGMTSVAPPETYVSVSFPATNAFLATNSTLGRPLSGGAPNQMLQLVEPYTVYQERRNELDIRFGKVLRVGRNRAVVSLDLFNALNSNAVINTNQSYAAYLRPTEILNARVAKFSVAYDF